VVLWLQGGPGCSGFDGWVYEHGPFVFSSSTNNGTRSGGGAAGGVRLAPNPYAWSRAATVIYVDSPVGVGLSYEEGAAPDAAYVTNDTRTAADADELLRELLARYAHLARAPLYVAGESYAGVYVPNLAAELVRGNSEGRQPRVNLKVFF
jgi:serine carboxypeptidase-like clade 1